MGRAIRRRTSRIRRTSLRRKTNRLSKKASRTSSSGKQRRELLQARVGAWSNFYLGLWQRGTAGEFAKSSISDVLQIFDPYFAGVKAIASASSQQGEEGYALA